MNKIAAFLICVAGALVIGCGGGGGGTGGSNSTSTTSSATTSTSTTSTSTTATTTGLSGVVMSAAGNTIQGALLKFYNSKGTLVGQATTNASGKFAAQLPTSTKAFTMDISNAVDEGNYFQQYTYKSNDYLDNDTSCLATSPTVVTGQMKNIGDTITIIERWLGPPPPPTGCLGG